MIEKKIVFITGAGASFDFGFPTGESLIEQLLKESWTKIQSENLGLRKLSDRFFNDFKSKLRLSNTPSIDIFIANNPGFAELSKALIAKIIASAESKSENKLFEKNWLKYLWTKMIEGCMSFDEFKDNQIKFITFNYDRTLEYFFSNSVNNFFNSGLPAQDLYKDLFKSIPIIHVFGKIGNLPWENGNKHRTYDAQLGGYESWHAVGQELKTIYESKVSINQNIISNMLYEAQEVFFLGFGYNSFNLELLKINNINSATYISGSRYNMSDSEVDDLNHLTNDAFKSLTIHQDYNCYDFLKNHLTYFSNKKSQNSFFK